MPEAAKSNSESLKKLYHDMLLIRRFEERAGQLYGMGLIGGFCHLYIGQEAVVVGLMGAAKQGDQQITAYRDHGHMLAQDVDPKAVMAELTGRAAGISKGSMYYYFDGKEDLFAHVTRVEFEKLFAVLGPVDLPAEPGPDAFWSAVHTYYLDSMAALAARPQLAALVRAWLASSANPALQQAQADLEQELMPWVERVLATGQARGAVRTDLPSGLLIAVALGMGRAMDTWVMTRQPGDDALPSLIGALVGMLRRALQP